MEVHIQFIGMDANEHAARDIRRRIRFALDRLAGSIRQVSVLLRDVNGPRGGVDQRCVIDVALRSQGEPVVAEARAENIRHSVAKALSRARRQLEKRAPTKRSRTLRASRG